MPAERHASTILRIDHSLMRQTLSTMTAVLRAGQWRRPGPALERLRELLHFEQAFEETCHRPKCYLMVKELRGRSPVVSGMMVAWDGDRATAALVLLRALGLLAAAEREEPGSDATLQALLEHRRDRVLEQLQLEETVLLAEANTVMSESQWSQLASEFSLVPSCAGVLHQADTPTRVVRRNPESMARFEDSGFALDASLDFDRVPLFRSAKRTG